MSERDENLDRSVEELELSVHSYNHLKSAKIATIRELVQKTESEMLKQRFGKKALNEIKEILGSMGLGLQEVEFQIEVPDYSSSIQDWSRAQKAPKSELPRLSADEKDVARRFRITEEDYARGVLAGEYGRERKTARAHQLGEQVQKLLCELSDGTDRVAAVVYDVDRLRWIVRVRTSRGIENVAIPLELADDVLDFGLREQIEALRSRLEYGLKREKSKTA